MRALILGGTFNPIHIGHLRLAIETAERLGCDHTVFLPSFAPIHRSRAHLLSFEFRVRLIETASAALPSVSVSDAERRHSGPPYSVDVLPALCAEAGIDAPCFAMGLEQFERLPSWYRGRDLPHLVDLAVGIREELGEAAFHRIRETAWPDFVAVEPSPGVHAAFREPDGPRRISLLAIPRLDVTATLIRCRWREGRSLAHLVPDPALALLLAHRDEVDTAWRRETER